MSGTTMSLVTPRSTAYNPTYLPHDGRLRGACPAFEATPCDGIGLKEIVLPVVNVQLYEGRTQQQKDDIAKGIAETISRVAEVPMEATVVIFSDTKRSDWHVGGQSQGS